MSNISRGRVGESDLRTAVTLLANHGLARPLKFGDLVLLRPDLINGYAGAVIRAARAHTDEIGCVLEADIYRPDFDFPGVERLKHRPALKRIWNEHQRCANKPAQGNALGTAFKNGKALKGRHQLSRPFRALFMMDELPRALPWAGLLPGLWP